MNRIVLAAVVPAFASAALIAPRPLLAQMSDAASDTRGKQPTAEDKTMAGERFVESAYSGNLLHIKASEYALTQVNDPKVRELAEKLMKDHAAANETLAAVAKAKGIEVSQELLPPQKAMMESAMKVKGEMFAVTYLINMTTLHVHDVLEFSHSGGGLRRAEIKAFAKGALPVLKEHRNVVRPMAEAKVKLEGGLQASHRAPAGNPRSGPAAAAAYARRIALAAVRQDRPVGRRRARFRLAIAAHFGGPCSFASISSPLSSPARPRPTPRPPPPFRN